MSVQLSSIFLEFQQFSLYASDVKFQTVGGVQFCIGLRVQGRV